MTVEESVVRQRMVSIGGSLYIPLTKANRIFHNKDNQDALNQKTHVAIIKNVLEDGKRHSIITFEKMNQEELAKANEVKKAKIETVAAVQPATPGS